MEKIEASNHNELQGQISSTISLETPRNGYKKLHFLRKMLMFVYNLTFFIIAAVALLIYVPLIHVLFSVVEFLPMPKKAKSSANGGLKIFTHHILLASFSFLFPNKIYVAQDARISDKNRGILISNHLCDFDWMFISHYQHSIGKLEHLFITMKEPLSKIPLIGYIMKKMGHIFIKQARTWDLSESQPTDVLKEASNAINEMEKGWVLIFPEGTYQYYDASLRSINHLKKSSYDFEGKCYTPKNVLTPKENGFKTICDSFSTSEGIINLTMMANPFIKRLDNIKVILKHMLFGSKEFNFVVIADYIPMNEVQRSPRYLQEIFCQKDGIITKFEETAVERSGQDSDPYKIASAQDLESFLVKNSPNTKYEYKTVRFYTPYWPMYVLSALAICFLAYKLVQHLSIAIFAAMEPLKILNYY